MKNYLIIVIVSLLSSCSQNCTECEQKLKDCMSADPIVIHLPKPKLSSDELSGFPPTIRVNAQDKYVYEEKEYSLDELTTVIDALLKTEANSVKELRIFGDKAAHYEAVFALITLAKKSDLSPVLMFEK